jgi:hypothetical protein
MPLAHQQFVHVPPPTEKVTEHPCLCTASGCKCKVITIGVICTLVSVVGVGIYDLSVLGWERLGYLRDRVMLFMRRWQRLSLQGEVVVNIRGGCPNAEGKRVQGSGLDTLMRVR